LGGAALTKSFIDDYCKPIYSGAIFYCKDAFDGVVAMGRIEKGDMNIDLGDKEEQESSIPKPKPTPQKLPPLSEIKMPNRDIEVVTPLFWGRKVLDFDAKELAFDWINHKNLFANRWGYSKKGKTKEEYEKILDDEVYPLFEKLKEELISKNLFEPVAIYGYYPCRADDNTLLLFDESEGYFNKDDINKEPLNQRKKRAKYRLTFPRQQRKPYRALSDYFQKDRDDVVALTCVSSGVKLSTYLTKLHSEGKYKEYHLVSALAGELAEALAEIVHKQIRIELNIIDDEKPTLRDVQMKRYHGKRYSFGYASCPDMSLNQTIFDLLKPQEFGIKLSESFLIDPEHSTSAMVVHNREALYYTVE